MAPGDGVTQRLLPSREIARATGELQQPTAEPVQQHRRRQHLHPGRRQLDGQRQPVQPLADLGQLPRVLLGHVEVGANGLGTADEEGNRLGASYVGQARAAARQSERRHRSLALAPKAQRRPAGGQNLDGWARGEKVGNQRGRGGEEMLAVVEEHQQLAGAERSGKVLGERAIARLGDPDRTGDGRQH